MYITICKKCCTSLREGEGGGGGESWREWVVGSDEGGTSWREGDESHGDTECRYTLLKMRILAFLHTNPTIHLI